MPRQDYQKNKILKKRIYLSPPDVSKRDRKYLEKAWNSGWIAPLGPEVDQFEKEFALKTGSAHAVATNSGTAALHLTLRMLGIGPGDKVVVPSLTLS